LEAEDYRTVDGALRAYHIHQANGHWNPDLVFGDYGQMSTLPSDGGKPFGAIYPTFFIVALANSPYDDGNDTPQSHDTRMTVDEMQKRELMLRAGCEGWMDSLVSVELVCAANPLGVGSYDEGHLFDFTFEALNFQAHGGRWIGSVGEALRSENPEGFGPLPNTKLYADTFNKISQCVNLLTRARLPIPAVVQQNLRQYEGAQDRTFTASEGCTRLFDASAPAADTLVNDPEAYGWADVESISGWSIPGWQVFHSARVNDDGDGLVSNRNEVAIRVAPSEGWEHCIPPDLLALLVSGYGGVIARQVRVVSANNITSDCSWELVPSDPEAEYIDEGCQIFTAGTYNSPAAPMSDYTYGGELPTDAAFTRVVRLMMLADQTFVEVPTV